MCKTSIVDHYTWTFSCITVSPQARRVTGVSSRGFVGGVGAALPGFEFCIEEFTPVGSFSSQYCLPNKRPRSCNQRIWNELQNGFLENCPTFDSIGGKFPKFFSHHYIAIRDRIFYSFGVFAFIPFVSKSLWQSNFWVLNFAISHFPKPF